MHLRRYRRGQVISHVVLLALSESEERVVMATMMARGLSL